MTAAWDFVSAHAEVFGIKRICRVLEVSRSGYYRWIAGAEARTGRQAAKDVLVEEIREIHAEHRGGATARFESMPNCAASATWSTASAWPG